jgi:hypothetical protein
MKKQTVDLIIRIGIEVAEWLAIILKEKRRPKKNVHKTTSKKKLKK